MRRRKEICDSFAVVLLTAQVIATVHGKCLHRPWYYQWLQATMAGLGVYPLKKTGTAVSFWKDTVHLIKSVLLFFFFFNSNLTICLLFNYDLNVYNVIIGMIEFKSIILLCVFYLFHVFFPQVSAFLWINLLLTDYFYLLCCLVIYNSLLCYLMSALWLIFHLV